jgi:hypothetical protein
MIHAPIYYLGAGLSSITFTSNLLHLRMLCGQIRENGTISNTLLATMGSLQIKSGLTKLILHSPKAYSSWCDKGWTRRCWEILQDHNITFLSDTHHCPIHTRINDASLMETFAESKLFKPWQLRKINWCRIYLRAVTISDIATASGTSINPYRWNRTNPQPIEASPYTWPLQNKPDNTAWKIWRQAIRKCLIQNKIHKIHKQLITPLGQWTAPSRQNFEWYTKPNKRSLLHIPAHGPPRQHIQQQKTTTAAKADCENSTVNPDSTEPPPPPSYMTLFSMRTYPHRKVEQSD